MFRRADRPEGAPNETPLDKAVRALLPTVKSGTVNVYRPERKPGFPDLVATPSVHDDAALHWYQQSGYILWGAS